MRRILTLLPCLLLPALLWADGLFIHENPAQAGHCYLSNRAGDKVFQGEYQTDCFAIGTSQLGTDANHDEPVHGYHTVHLLRFRDQAHAVINLRGEVVYHSYWFDNGPDYVEDGVFRIRDAQGKIGYADGFTGRMVIAPQYACAFPFENGVAQVALSGKEVREDAEHRVCVGDDLKIDKQGKRVAE